MGETKLSKSVSDCGTAMRLFWNMILLIENHDLAAFVCNSFIALVTAPDGLKTKPRYT